MTRLLPAPGLLARRIVAPRPAAKGLRPPRRPSRIPVAPRPPVPLTPRARIVRSSLLLVAALLLSFVLNVTVVGHVQHLVSQQNLSNEFRAQLADGTAPVGEGDVDGVLLADGAPVAELSIPSIGVKEIIVEGTDSGTLRAGPGHRRDTVLPGQAGVSVIMARAAAYGGPFSRLQELAPGDRFGIVTGQGQQYFEVIGLRYAGDPAPPALTPGESRLILTTARGMPFSPTGIARVDARPLGDPLPNGARLTNFVTLPTADRELMGDPGTVWALVFALQFLLLVEVAAVWCHRRIGPRQTWIVFAPVAFLAVLVTSDQVIRLLPNLL